MDSLQTDYERAKLIIADLPMDDFVVVMRFFNAKLAAAADERQAQIVAWLKQEAMAAVHMTLAAGLPGPSAHTKAKMRQFADGYSKAVSLILAGIESGAWKQST